MEQPRPRVSFNSKVSKEARVCGKLNHQSNTVGSIRGAKNNNARAICSMQLVCLDNNDNDNNNNSDYWKKM